MCRVVIPAASALGRVVIAAAATVGRVDTAGGAAVGRVDTAGGAAVGRVYAAADHHGDHVGSEEDIEQGPAAAAQHQAALGPHPPVQLRVMCFCLQIYRIIHKLVAMR